MPALARGQASSCENPALDLFTQVGGVLTDVEVLEYQVFDVSDAAKQLNPVQVYPETAGQRAAVNVSELCPIGDKLSTGHFVARWTPPLDEPIGTHEMRWFFKLTASSPEQTFKEEFEVLPEVVAQAFRGYCFVSDLRAEGVSETQASDDRLISLIDLASRYIDEVTGRFFEAREMTLDLDGRGSAVLQLGVPIIAISDLSLLGDAGETEIDTGDCRVYNRHLTQRLTSPDDRENPKIALVGGGRVFPEGHQNVRLEGLFGYTEHDGSPAGRTPRLIREVCKKLVIREMPLLGDAGGRDDAQRRSRLISEKTRDQSYRLANPKTTGAMTGDTEIDTVLAMFTRPMEVGAA